MSLSGFTGTHGRWSREVNGCDLFTFRAGKDRRQELLPEESSTYRASRGPDANPRLHRTLSRRHTLAGFAPVKRNIDCQQRRGPLNFFQKAALFSSIFALAFLSGCNAKDPSQLPQSPTCFRALREERRKAKLSKKPLEKGMCHLPDGTVVEEWELFRRDNHK